MGEGPAAWAIAAKDSRKKLARSFMRELDSMGGRG
jgi:hypothetical protein